MATINIITFMSDGPASQIVYTIYYSAYDFSTILGFAMCMCVCFHISCMRHADEANSGASAAYVAVNSEPERCLHRFMHLCRAEFEMGAFPR